MKEEFFNEVYEKRKKILFLTLFFRIASLRNRAPILLIPLKEKSRFLSVCIKE